MIGKTYDIQLQRKFLKNALIEDIKTLRFDDINEFVAHIDMGYSAAETKEILKKMYKEATNQKFYFILLKTVK